MLDIGTIRFERQKSVNNLLTAADEVTFPLRRLSFMTARYGERMKRLYDETDDTLSPTKQRN